MSSYIQGFANTAISYTKAVNSYVQDIPYAGRVWSLARDKIVLPGAALAAAAWTACQPRISQTADWVAANKGPAAAIVVGLISAFIIGRKLIGNVSLGAPSLEKQLETAKKALTDHQAIVARLDQAHKDAAAKDQTVDANKVATAKAKADLDTANADTAKFQADVAKAQNALDDSKKAK